MVTIDGTEIVAGSTIDAEEISQITMDGDIAWEASTAIPENTIILWGGSISSTPSGWNLADGSNGTPDMTDRFLKGTTGSLSTGGESSVSYSHNHNISVNNTRDVSTEDDRVGFPSSSDGNTSNETISVEVDARHTKVAYLVADSEKQEFPSGAIVSWNEPHDNIPDGWVVADGENETIDLARSAYARCVPNSSTDPGEYINGQTDIPAHQHDLESLVTDVDGGSNFDPNFRLRVETADDFWSATARSDPPYVDLTPIQKL